MNGLPDQPNLERLAAASETALVRARDLLAWWNSGRRPDLFDLEPPTPTVRIQGFFSTLTLEGRTSSVMGCLQTSLFRPQPSASSGARLGDAVRARFLRESCWANPDGSKGGFWYRPTLVKEPGSPARKLAPGEEVTLDDIGSRYDSAVVRLEILDYVKIFPVIGRFHRLLDQHLKEGAYMVFHPFLSETPYPPPPSGSLEACFGYAVAPWQIYPSFQGYGPGRFYSALKQYRFFRMDDGSVLIEVAFVVAPRTEKILNVLGLDPVYGTVRLLDALTFRATGINQSAHDGMDRFALGHHGRVHRNLLEGMRPIWEGNRWGAASLAAV